MKKCLFSDCSHTDENPAITFYTVVSGLDPGKPSSSQPQFICSEHYSQLKLKFSKKTGGSSSKKDPIAKENSTNETPLEKFFCSAIKCGITSTSHPDVCFFKFPSGFDSRYKIWIEIADHPPNPRWLCARHFDIWQFIDDNRKLLTSTAVPKYKAGPLNTVTGDYAPTSQDVPENGSSSKKPTQSEDEMGSNLRYRQCDAMGCNSAYQRDPSVKYFNFPAPPVNANQSGKKSRYQLWCDFVGGVTKGRARYLCQYHFPAVSFTDPQRTSLVRRSIPLFPFGPLNPKTRDFCPIGEEERSLSSNAIKRTRCCVDQCSVYSRNVNGLFGFPQHDKEAFAIWVERVGINMKCFTEEYVKSRYRICPRHFSHHCAKKSPDGYHVLLEFGALPTLNLPCFDEPPNERNSILRTRRIALMDVEGLRATSASERLCTFYDIGDSESNNRMALILERKADEMVFRKTPITQDKSRDLPRLKSHTPRAVTTELLEDDNSKTAEDYAYNDSSNNNESENSREAKSNNAVDTPSQVGATTQKIKHTTNPRVTYWTPEDFDYPEAARRKRQMSLAAARVASENKPVKKVCRNSGKTPTDTSLKKLYEDFSMDIAEDCNIGNEVDIEAPVEPKQNTSTPTKKYDTMEIALMEIFNSAHANDDNAFTCFSDSSKIPEHDEHNDKHLYCSASSLNIIRSAAELCEFNDVKIKQLERLIGDGEDTSETLENILVKHLSSVLCITGVDFLKKCFDKVIQEAVNKKKEKDKSGTSKWCQLPKEKPKKHENVPEEMKKFAVALQTFSGKAYHAMTEIMDLPSPTVARLWATHGDGNPGFSEISFKVLKEEVVKDLKKRVTVCLSMEEVPLKKDVTWDGERLFGYTDFGFGALDNDHVPEASKAIVFFASALNRSWKIPLGYVLGDNISPQVRANLITQYIVKLDSTGIKCVAVACNYSYLTYQTFHELGALVENDSGPLMGTFVNPMKESERVHCFVDVHQLVKSMTNLLAEKKTFQFRRKDIDWNHINRLKGVKFDESLLSDDVMPSISLAERDPRSYTKFCSSALTILRNLGATGTDETTVFLDKLTSVTEMFSSCHKFDVSGRRPINKKNVQLTIGTLSSNHSYFSCLTFPSGEKICKSERKMPFTLLCMNMASLKSMLKRILYGEKYQVKNLLTESLQLGNISQTFCQLTGKENLLLTALEFKNAFSKHMESFSLAPSHQVESFGITEEGPEIKTEDYLGFRSNFSYEFTPITTLCETAPEFLTKNVIENWLEIVDCSECSSLIQRELIAYRKHDSKDNVIGDIDKMLRSAETIMSGLDDIPVVTFKTWFDKFANKTLNSLNSIHGFKNNDHLFTSARFGEVTHMTVMIKDMLRIFLRLRLCFLARKEKIKIRTPRHHSLRFHLGRSWA